MTSQQNLPTPHADAINVLMYFVVAMLSFQLLAKHSSAALPCKQLVNKRL